MSCHACCYKNGHIKCIVTIISKIFLEKRRRREKKMSNVVHKAPATKGSRLGGTNHTL